VQWDRGEPNLARQSYRKAIQLDGRYRERGFLSHLAQAAFSEEQIKTVEKISPL